MSPFDFVNQINHGKINLIDETPEVEGPIDGESENLE